MNSVSLIGRLTRDPEVRYGQASQTAVARFSIAIDRGRDRDGNVNVMIGKCSFSDEALAENFKAIYDQIVKIKPSAVKGTYIKNLTLSTTMGPGIHVSVE